MFYQCFANVLPMFYQCLLMFYQCFTNVLPMFNQCFTNVLPMLQRWVFSNVMAFRSSSHHHSTTCCPTNYWQDITYFLLQISKFQIPNSMIQKSKLQIQLYKKFKFQIPTPAARPTIGNTSYIFFYNFQIQWYEESTKYENNVFLLHWKNSIIRFQNLILAILNQIKGIFHLLHNNCKAIPSKGLPSPNQMGPFHENIICLE